MWMPRFLRRQTTSAPAGDPAVHAADSDPALIGRMQAQAAAWARDHVPSHSVEVRFAADIRGFGETLLLRNGSAVITFDDRLKLADDDIRSGMLAHETAHLVLHDARSTHATPPTASESARFASAAAAVLAACLVASFGLFTPALSGDAAAVGFVGGLGCSLGLFLSGLRSQHTARRAVESDCDKQAVHLVGDEGPVLKAVQWMHTQIKTPRRFRRLVFRVGLALVGGSHPSTSNRMETIRKEGKALREGWAISPEQSRAALNAAAATDETRPSVQPDEVGPPAQPDEVGPPAREEERPGAAVEAKAASELPGATPIRGGPPVPQPAPPAPRPAEGPARPPPADLRQTAPPADPAARQRALLRPFRKPGSHR